MSKLCFILFIGGLICLILSLSRGECASPRTYYSFSKGKLSSLLHSSGSKISRLSKIKLGRIQKARLKKIFHLTKKPAYGSKDWHTRHIAAHESNVAEKKKAMDDAGSEADKAYVERKHIIENAPSSGMKGYEDAQEQFGKAQAKYEAAQAKYKAARMDFWDADRAKDVAHAKRLLEDRDKKSFLRRGKRDPHGQEPPEGTKEWHEFNTATHNKDVARAEQKMKKAARAVRDANNQLKAEMNQRQFGKAQAKYKAEQAKYKAARMDFWDAVAHEKRLSEDRVKKSSLRRVKRDPHGQEPLEGTKEWHEFNTATHNKDVARAEQKMKKAAWAVRDANNQDVPRAKEKYQRAKTEFENEQFARLKAEKNQRNAVASNEQRELTWSLQKRQEAQGLE
jgi:hypothetical protein